MYYRLTKGLNSIGKFIPETDDVHDHISPGKDYYLSIYKYNEEQKNLAEEVVTNESVNEDTGEVLESSRPRGVGGIKDVTTNK